MRSVALAFLLGAAGLATLVAACKADPTRADGLCERYKSECLAGDATSFCLYVDAVEHDASGGDCQDELDTYFSCGDALPDLCDFTKDCDAEGRAMFTCLENATPA